MNLWQKSFIVMGCVATALLILFPPQFITSSTVRFLYIGEGFPIDWLRLFMWLVAVIIVTALGVAVNKQEHGD